MKNFPVPRLIRCLGAVLSGAFALFLSASPVGLGPPSSPRPPTAAATRVESTAGEQRVPPLALETDPYAFVSAERMLSALGQLTAFGENNLWRTSGSAGEREAFVWLRERLAELTALSERGATVTRQTFRIPLSTEVWEARLELERGGVGYLTPVHAIQGHREILSRTLRFDTDGQPNDATHNPVVVAGAPRVIRTYNELHALGPADLYRRLALVDYAVFDLGVVDQATARNRAAELLGKTPAAIVLVTSYANWQGVAHGSFAGDVNVFVSLDSPAPVPTAFTRLEDLGPAGIHTWADLNTVSRAILTLDVDVFSPGESELTYLHIPGQDNAQAVILGAHLDSPNTPGALDNGSGSVALLEAARALDALGDRPPSDTYLCWFGSHERGLYGSTTFTLSHQDLLDRTLGMQQVDCLGHAAEGLEPQLHLEQWSYSGWGDFSTPFSLFMAAAAAPQGDALWPIRYDGVGSDNSSFVGFDVPSANLILMDPVHQNEVHIDNHLHDPYDTLELAALHGNELEASARAFLAAALELGAQRPALRVTRPPLGRAVFVASHTEQPHMTPAAHTVLGMALAWEGLDVDVVPYGQPVTPADLEGAALVVALPVLDYPTGSGVHPYDEAWSAEETAAIQDYAENGGFLVLTTSAFRLKQPNAMYDANEDWPDVNGVGAPLGVTFADRPLAGNTAAAVASHALVQGVASLALAPGNGKAIDAPGGILLAAAGAETAAALVAVGSSGGEVLALSDLGILGHQGSTVANLPFWRNLANYALARQFDLNGDRQVNAADLALLADYFTGRLDNLPCGPRCADVNRDGCVDILDLMTLAALVAPAPASAGAGNAGGAAPADRSGAGEPSLPEASDARM